MPFLLEFRRYALPLRSPVRTAHGPWSVRDGILLRLEAVGENVGGGGEESGGRKEGAASDFRTVRYAEIAPIPWFGTETVDEAEAAVRSLGGRIDDEASALVRLPAELGCTRGAIRTALRTEPEARHAHLPVAALLPAGRAAFSLIEPKAEMGFRVFKWKVGVADAADEIAMLDDVCARLPDGAKLRLDANGAWDRRTAERWLERCAERPVEFVEQPCFVPAKEGETARRKCEDVLMGLAEDYPTPLALDESLTGNGDIARWLGAGWRGVFVVKHSLLDDPVAALAQLSAANARVVFSSALETAVGARAALSAAFAWAPATPAKPAEPMRALGFGVWPLFEDARCDGPFAAPFLRAEDVTRIDVEAVWNALS